MSVDNPTVCGACLSRGRRVSPLGAARAARVLRAASDFTSGDSPHLGVELGAVSRLPLCWECHAHVERTVTFCDRVRRAQTILTSEHLAVLTDADTNASMSTLSSKTIVGFDYEFNQPIQTDEIHYQDTDLESNYEIICGKEDAPTILGTHTSAKVTLAVDDSNVLDVCTKNNIITELNISGTDCFEPNLDDSLTNEIHLCSENNGVISDDTSIKDLDLINAIPIKVNDNTVSNPNKDILSGDIDVSVDEDNISDSSEQSSPVWDHEMSPLNDLPEVGLEEEVADHSSEASKKEEHTVLSKNDTLESENVIVMKDLTKNNKRKKLLPKKVIKIEEANVTIKRIKGNYIKESNLSDFKVNQVLKSFKIPKLNRNDQFAHESDKNLVKSQVPIKMSPAPSYISLRPGRVSTTFMSEAEMLESREEDRNAESYVKSLFKCQTCIVGFNNGAFLEEHNLGKHSLKNGAHVCDICKVRFPTVLNVTNHRRSHYHLYVCGACGYTQRQLADVNRHYTDVHEADRSFPCGQCGELFRKFRQLKYHREKVHMKPKQCPHCDKSFSCRNTYNRHIELHTGMPVYECAICARSCRGKALLAAHMRTHEPNGGDAAYCAECDTHFKNKYIYRQHLRTSRRHVARDDLRHACDKCDRKFTSPGELRTHQDIIHLNKELFKCDACDKNYINPRGLKLHMLKVHEGVRPAKDKFCEVCGRGFSSNSILATHRRTHTGERPHVCSQCGATFRQSGALYKHTELVHGARSGARAE